MAQRPKETVKRPAARAKARKTAAPAASKVSKTSKTSARAASKTSPRAAAKATAPAGSADTRVRTLERERDALKRELETARQRIAALEENRSAVASRIDWIIESLTTVVEKNG